MRFSHQNTESVRQSVCGIIFCLIVWSHIIIFHHNWGSQSSIRKLLCPFFLSQNEISWPSLYSLKNMKVCCLLVELITAFESTFNVLFLLLHLSVWVLYSIVMWLCMASMQFIFFLNINASISGQNMASNSMLNNTAQPKIFCFSVFFVSYSVL